MVYNQSNFIKIKINKYIDGETLRKCKSVLVYLNYKMFVVESSKGQIEVLDVVLVCAVEV